MKKKFLLAISLMLVFGLAAVTFAISSSNVNTNAAASCCCCNGDSCPLKSKDAGKTEGEQKAVCCDKETSAQKDGETAQTAPMDMTNVTVITAKGSCCHAGADCCKSGTSCKSKKTAKHASH